MGQRKKPRGLPLRPDLGGLLGAGQDNAVYELLTPAERPHLRAPLDTVVKISHEAKEMRGRHADDREAAWRGVLYKRNKYDLLKHFLGDFIPNSSFVLSRVVEKAQVRYTELTLQDRVPQRTLGSLTPQQRSDPRLRQNLGELLGRMQYMYGVLGEVNARTAGSINLDAKLDLGGLSDKVRGESLDHVFNDDDLTAIINENNSPNLLVDPDTLHLYCIDFDQGQWEPGMNEAKELAFRVDERNQQVRALGAAAVS